MKKLLIFMLVLGMASVASATLQISVNGDMNDSPEVITLCPYPQSELQPYEPNCILDIFTDTGIPSMSPYDLVLIVDTGCGLITDGVPLKPNGSAGIIFYTAQQNVTNVPVGQDGGVFVFGTLDNAIPAMTKIFDYILFTCVSANGPTVITLAGIDPDWVYYDPAVIYDQVTINQVPEPMTIMLLGLGGLLLRRRK